MNAPDKIAEVDPSKTGDLFTIDGRQKPSLEATQSLNTPPAGDARTCSILHVDASSHERSNDRVPALQSIGRYRVEKILGEGGFGIVYLAHDDELKRQVAIKVPQAHRIRSSKDAGAYLVEAQILAKLDHPHIVPVHDVGRTSDGLPFVVSKFIEGSDLAHRMKQARHSIRECAILVARMAEALHYAHQHSLVHRDVKPGNILIDISDKPFLVDFGLALKEEDFGKGGGILGTPAYMSPEQANGEGHLVDGRSDIFSLGVVLYELLTGRRPFVADNTLGLLMQVVNLEARPPRQIDSAIPKELERINLKALAKRASERYPTALDFSDDLKHWLEPAEIADKGQVPLKIIPKGLRSFDAHDADFFLELLPGPRDREGLPDTLRFWKTRIEETDADTTFRVGVIYGPSGCGKSSFVKAGLLPRLADTVQVVYVEATPEDTETRLLRGLQKACSDLPRNLSLREAIAHLRRDERFRQKVVLVVDQFEQWLHGKNNQKNAELVQALRQCDGKRIQCIVMVRDDFWLAVSRFMKNLEIRIVEGQNSALVDLFDMRHAHNVLTAFGKAFGTLSENAELTRDQAAFLEQAVAGLAQEGKVFSVRLALFAEMVKGKAWKPATLKQVGGTEGVGVTFLEETFAASTAPPQHRLHQRTGAAQRVLKSLLPEIGTDIKGHMRSHAELLAASGYANRPRDFDDLIRILDGEIRLITPTDPEGKEDQGEPGASVASVTGVNGEPGGVSHRNPGEKYYQLTHDYLVPSLRAWLTRKEKETRRGRAELLLADRAAAWNARPENRQLPSLSQWVRIRSLTQKKNWTKPQRKMMRKAGWYHGVRGLVLAILLTVGTLTGLMIRDRVTEERNANHAADLVHRLLDAKIGQVPGIVSEINEYRPWAAPLLRKKNAEAVDGSAQKLHTSLALLPVDGGQVNYLYGRLLNADPDPGDVVVIQDALGPHKEELLNKLWAVVESPQKGKESQRLRAASALAAYDPESQRWASVSSKLVGDLVAVNPVYLGIWSDRLRPVKAKLLDPLSDIFRDHQPERAAERALATNLLADYAADQPQQLAKLLMDADEKQFAAIYPKFKEHGNQGLSVLTGEIDKKLPPDLPSSDDSREKLAKRQANAAVVLLKMGQAEKVWPLLKHSLDPRVRSYLIHRFGPLGADAGAIVKRLDEELDDVTIRRALILSLGEFEEKELSADDRNRVTKKLQKIYLTTADPGLHAASEWMLRTWKQDKWLKKTNAEWAKEEDQREKKIEAIKQTLAKEKEKTPPQWYVNGQGQTMVVIPGPVMFVMSSPPTEVGRDKRDIQHKKRIGRAFALAAKPVTMGQFLDAQVLKTREKYFGKDEVQQYAPTDDCPAITMSWHMAAEYCNWLSKKEGIDPEQWCYEIKGGVAKLKKNHLSLSGYRLPTEAEMEYATRAGAMTSWCFGETEELLAKYAWYTKNSEDHTWPVGSKKPNDFGLFDVQGNVFTWCQDWYTAYPVGGCEEVFEDQEQEDGLKATSRVLRGGSFNHKASILRSAFRNNSAPTNRSYNYGFRVARTLPLGPLAPLPLTSPKGAQRE